MTARRNQIRTWGFQEDMFGGTYRLISAKGNGYWLIEDLAPTPEEIVRIRSAKSMTPVQAEEEIQRRILRAGRQSTIRFATRKAYARYF